MGIMESHETFPQAKKTSVGVHATPCLYSEGGGKSAVDLARDFTWGTIDKLEQLGAIQCEEDELGELCYSVRPAGIRLNLVMHVQSVVYDIDVDRMERMGCAVDRLAKLELVVQLMATGFRPVGVLRGDTG